MHAGTNAFPKKTLVTLLVLLIKKNKNRHNKLSNNTTLLNSAVTSNSHGTESTQFLDKKFHKMQKKTCNRK